MENKWLIYSVEHGGMWWLPNSNGYTRDRKSAGRYTFKQVLQIVTDANQFCRRDELHETMCPDY